VLLRGLSTRCLADPQTYVSVVEALAVFNDRDVFSQPLTTGPLLAYLVANTPALPNGAPLLIAQGLADPLVVPAVQQAYAKSLCDAGQALDYLEVPDKDHVALVEPDSPLVPQLLEWTEDRFAGMSVPNGCENRAGD
jgi:hypothetical protein